MITEEKIKHIRDFAYSMTPRQSGDTINELIDEIDRLRSVISKMGNKNE